VRAALFCLGPLLLFGQASVARWKESELAIRFPVLAAHFY